LLDWAVRESSPAALATALSKTWQPWAYLVYLSAILREMVLDAKAPKRLLILTPPRHGKSELISHWLPVWYLEMFPENDVVLTTYEATFAARWGGRVRDTIEANMERLRIRVKQTISARALWELETGGSMITAGAGGPITGRGGHLVIIDDPHKNIAEVMSKVYRDKIWDWYRGTLRDRLEPGAAVVCIMQRWHEDDLAGRLIRESEVGGEHWRVVSLPALAEDGDPVGRAPGQALCPERYDETALAETRRAIGDWLFSAKYQQQPKPAEGTLFKRSTFRYFKAVNGLLELTGPAGIKRVPRPECLVIQTCDPAATEKEQSDYFVIQTWLITPDGDRLLLDQFREKAETTKHDTIMREQYERYSPSAQYVESTSFGLNIIQGCTRQGLPILPVKADKSKYARALPLEAAYTAGLVYHRVDAPWLTDYEDELLAFPYGEHDDQVDAAAYAATATNEGLLAAGIVTLSDFEDNNA